MGICLIQAPYTVGDEHQGSSKGPLRFVEAGAGTMLAGKGIDVHVELVERGRPFRDSVSASTVVNKRVAELVRRVISAGHLPVVLAGSCDAPVGVLAGLEHNRCGVIWFDAHGDFNTPDTTASGFYGGMTAAVITGHCFANLWAQVGDSTPVPEANLLMLGVRDLDPLEEERLGRSDVAIVRWLDGQPQSSLADALDALASKVDEVYIHFDLDALDPRDAPGIPEYMVPGGLSLRQAEDALHAISTRFSIKAASVTCFNPDADRDEIALRAGLRIIELLAESVVARNN